jgi:hypothetical protein
MDSTSIVDYIQKVYPKITFNPIKFPYKRAVGFILSGDSLIIGFINKNGNLCKLIDPINMLDVTQDTLETALRKIPVVAGFTDNDKQRLLRLFDTRVSVVSQDEHLQITQDLKKQLADKDAEYKILFDSVSSKSLAVQKDYDEKIAVLVEEYKQMLQKEHDTATKLIEEKDSLLAELEKFKTETKDFVKSKDMSFAELTGLYTQLVRDKDKLQASLQLVVENEESRLVDLSKNKDLLSDYEEKIASKGSELQQLKNSVVEINAELERVHGELNKSALKSQMLEGQQTRCREVLLQDKENVLNKIQEYNAAWSKWSQTVQTDFETYKKSLIAQLQLIDKRLTEVIKAQTEMTQREKAKLKQNVKDIQAELQKTVADQLITLNEKDDQIRMLQSAGIGFVVGEASEQSCANKDAEIQALKRELEEVRRMIVQNNKAKIDVTIDYDNCYSIVQNFFALNNIFYRKQEIIKKLNEIISGDMESFTNLPESTKTDIKSRFEVIKAGIEKHIAFLDLEKYMTAPDFQYLKSKATQNKVSPNFCTELTNILDYWNANKAEYREQEVQLTNIYEDLSGAVRVYIRIKPLIGIEQKNKTVTIQMIDNKKQKSLNLQCTTIPTQSFGEFYGVFDPVFSNLDVYTGQENTPVQPGTLLVDIDGIVEASDTASPGLYSVFRQVEDGYAVVLFGYGLSGSGKTFSLLGSNGVPGLLHYGLANLKGVETIKLKYLFEQYYRAVDVNFGKIRGRIHNLKGEVPQMREYSADERTQFLAGVPSSLNLDDLGVEDLYKLTETIEAYRISQKRIKKTPNNPVSSRSHLYMVFEIKFKSGTTGYVTVVDTAGRESPLDIFNTFIDSTKTKLASIMAPAPVGGEGAVAKSKRSDIDQDYTPQHIFEVLKEGFYINETINHLVYFLNQKNYRKTKVHLQPGDPSKYSIANYYVNPVKEQQFINTVNNCLTIPIMNFLDSLSNKQKSSSYKPTKFIMMCMVRQEEKYCDQILETLEFAQNIKSS